MMQPIFITDKKSTNFRSAGRPFLRRQESPRANALPAKQSHNRQNHPHTFVHPQTIPAKAGISQTCVANGGVESAKGGMPPANCRPAAPKRRGVAAC